MKIILIIAICLLVVATIIVIWGVLTHWKFVCNKRDNYDEQFSIQRDIIHFRYKTSYIKRVDSLHDVLFTDKSIDLKKPPPIFAHFDYIIYGDAAGNKISGNAKTAKIVYCEPDKALKYNFNEFTNLSKGEKRVLVVMGEDTHSDRLDKNSKKKLLDKFSTIFWEANTDPDFITLPMGLISLYIAKNGAKNIEYAIKTAGNTNLRKLCIIPQWNIFSTGLVTASRARLTEFIKKHKTNLWFDFKKFSPVNYYKGLSKYKFAVCPTGNGIQTPKIFEAILVKTIPIVENELVFRQLRQYGLPLLIVDNWNQLSQTFLNQQYIKMHINWKNAIYLCSVKGVVNKILHYI